MTDSTHNALTSQCPLCGEPNQCARAIDASATDCWCFHTDIPRQLLEQIPPAQRGRQCICPDCATSVTQLAHPAN